MLGSAKIAHPRFQRPRSSLFCPVSGLKVYEFYLKYRRCTYVLLGPEITNTDLDTILCAVLDGITPILEDYIKETILDSMVNIMVCLFPKAPQPADNNRLRPVSNIEPHPLHLQDLHTFLQCLLANWTCPEQAVFFELMCHSKQSSLGILSTEKGKITIQSRLEGIRPSDMFLNDGMHVKNFAKIIRSKFAFKVHPFDWV